jgi:hypothetical protein
MINDIWEYWDADAWGDDTWGLETPGTGDPDVIRIVCTYQPTIRITARFNG